MTIQELGKKFKGYFGFNPPIDMMLTMVRGSNKAVLDVIKLDDEFNNRDSEYDADKCTYKGEKDISPSKYILLKYGEEAHNFIKNHM